MSRLNCHLLLSVLFNGAFFADVIPAENPNAMNSILTAQQRNEQQQQ